MKLKWALLPVLAVYWFSIAPPVAGYKIVCYYGSWAVYRPGEGKFDVEDIDPFICTHIVYAFVGINNDGSIRIMDSWNEIDKAALHRFSCLKKINPELKTFIPIGGWNEGSVTFSNVAKNPALRANFIRNAIALVKTFNFDGFDLDWEYPSQRGGVPEDVPNFVSLVKEFRIAFDSEKLLITAAVAACESSASQSYDILQISQYLHFINVMTYDMHGSWDPVTGHNAPLFASPDGLHVDECISYWLRKGAPPEKLILGIGTYGRTFTLRDANNNGIGAPVTGPGLAGSITRESGYLGYNEICVNNWPRKWHEDQKVPYAHQGNQWVGYDDPESIGHKANYVRARGLGGIMIWSFETDDFRGRCGPRNPLLIAIRSGLGLVSNLSGDGWGGECATGGNPGVTTPGGTNPGGTNPGGSDPPPDGICSKTGYVRDSQDCSVFYQCEHD